LVVGQTPGFASDFGDEVILGSGNDVSELSQTDLSEDRGTHGEDSVVSTQSLAATTSGNTLSVLGNLTNGAISIGDQLGGAGFGSYVMNTGNNSTLNAATSLTIQMTTAP